MEVTVLCNSRAHGLTRTNSLSFGRRNALFLTLAKAGSRHCDEGQSFSLRMGMEFVVNRFAGRGLSNLIFGVTSHRVSPFPPGMFLAH